MSPFVMYYDSYDLPQLIVMGKERLNVKIHIGKKENQISYDVGKLNIMLTTLPLKESMKSIYHGYFLPKKIFKSDFNV